MKALLIETASVLTPFRILCIAKQGETTARNGRILNPVDTLPPFWGRSSTTGSKALTHTPGNYYKLYNNSSSPVHFPKEFNGPFA